MSFIDFERTAYQYDTKASLVSAMRNAIFTHPSFKDNERVTFGLTSDSVVLSLHNKDNRPTRYTLEITPSSTASLGKLTPTVTLDTIINEIGGLGGHASLKRPNISLTEGLNHLLELSQQPCDGTPENTKLRYQSMGLLERKRKEAPTIPNRDIEAAKMVDFISAAYTTDNPEHFKSALIQAFNQGMKDGRMWVDEYLTQEVNELLFDNHKDTYIPNALAPVDEPFPLAKERDSLYVAVEHTTNTLSNIKDAISGYGQFNFSNATSSLIGNIKSTSPGALKGLRSTMDNDTYEAHKNAFDGFDSRGVRTYDLQSKLAPRFVTYSTEEQGASMASEVIGAAYSHALGLIERINTLEAVHALRDTIILHDGIYREFSVEDTGPILNKLNQSDVLACAMHLNQSEFTFLTTDAAEAMITMQVEAKDIPQGEKLTKEEVDKMMSSMVDDIINEMDPPEYDQKERERKQQLRSKIDTFAASLPSTEVDEATVVKISALINNTKKLSADNPEFNAKYLRTELDKTGYVLPDDITQLDSVDLTALLTKCQQEKPARPAIPEALLATVPTSVPKPVEPSQGAKLKR